MKQQTVTILGTGYVGLTTAALTATAGMKTYVVDPNPVRLDSVRAGKSFFYEAGLDALVARSVSEGMLVPTSSYAEAVPWSDIVISAVGTPDNPDGSSNLTYVFAAATEAAKHLAPHAVYVQKSTVPVGTGERVRSLFEAAGIANAYVSNPEFLREGTALFDSLWFDRVVVGGDDAAAMDRVCGVYRAIEAARDDIAALASLDAPRVLPAGAYETVGLESAELTKVTANAFLALKISFANSIAMLADKVGADVTEVMHAVGGDVRIGRAFLQAGRGYGGGCFPKDVAGLVAAGLERGVDLAIMRAAQAVNEAMPGYIIEKLQVAMGGSLEGRRVVVLGLSFKAGTSDARRSPGVTIANMLVHAGAEVPAFDPKAHAEAADMLDPAVCLAASIPEALEHAEALVVATDWPEFINYPAEEYAKHLTGGWLVDAVNRLDAAALQTAGVKYMGVGR